MSRTADPSRDLLFGLIALQNGLIDQDQLVNAFRAWTRDKAHPLAEYLADRGNVDADDRVAVEALVARHLKKHGGEAEKSLAALTAGRSTREGLANIGDPDLGGSLAHVGSASTRHEGDTDPDRTASYVVGAATSDGQRFRVLRPHASGGLGAVFVALDQELHREVALKQILAHHADDATSRRRFLIEAEITGGLEHPGIVPVYGLGTYGDGRPYYTMRFIRGDSLKEAIEAFHGDEGLKKDPGRRSLELRKLLRRFTDVCNAVEYAHSRGVLHRDLKPGNVIVGKHGETLVVDWGLAKATGQAAPASGERILMPSSASGSAETLPGSALGTPAYMSPEQAEGRLDQLGPRSDVYSLGATLYCLLTGGPPFAGEMADVIRSVQRGQFRPPRQVDGSIDRALQAVCLKAMALQPTDRHGSPKALAEDLERWMADEPVSAWREPWGRRALRWMRRRRTAMTAAAAATLVALLGLAGVLAVQARANHSLHAANERERERFDLALEAVRYFHSGVSEDLLLRESQFDGLRNRLLGGARDFYHKLEGMLEGQTDRRSRVALGLAYFEVGELTSRIGSREEALAIHSRALELRQALAREPGAGPAALAAVGLSHQAIGRVLRDMGRAEESLAEQTQGRLLLEAWSKLRPDDIKVARDLQRSFNGTVHALGDLGRWPEVLKATEEMIAFLEPLTRADPANTWALTASAEGYYDIAVSHLNSGHPAAALASLERARAIAQEALESRPDDVGARRMLGLIDNGIGASLGMLNRPTEALASYVRSRNLLESLVKAYPTSTELRFRLSEPLLSLGGALGASGRTAEAQDAYQAALATLEPSVQADPTAGLNRLMLATAHDGLGHLYLLTQSPARAAAAYEAARAIVEPLLAAAPATVYFQSALASSLCGLGILRQQARRPAEAVPLLRRAIATWERIPSPLPGDLYGLACAHAWLGAGLPAIEAGPEAETAMDFLRQAVAAGQRDTAMMRNDPGLEPLRTRTDFRWLMMDLAMPDEPFAAVNEIGPD
jgi:serine/threonine-protein kinase